MENMTLFVELTDEQLQKITGGKSACDRGCNGGHDHYYGNDCDYRPHHHYGHNHYGFPGGNDCHSSCYHRPHPCHTSYCG